MSIFDCASASLPKSGFPKRRKQFAFLKYSSNLTFSIIIFVNHKGFQKLLLSPLPRPWRTVSGRGEIRTHDTLSDMTVFKTVALNHSATLPCLIMPRGCWGDHSSMFFLLSQIVFHLISIFVVCKP